MILRRSFATLSEFALFTRTRAREGGKSRVLFIILRVHRGYNVGRGIRALNEIIGSVMYYTSVYKEHICRRGRCVGLGGKRVETHAHACVILDRQRRRRRRYYMILLAPVTDPEYVLRIPVEREERLRWKVYNIQACVVYLRERVCWQIDICWSQ